MWTARKGQSVPMHTHDEGDEHVTIVLSGSILVSGPDFAWSKALEAGEAHDFGRHQQTHAIDALEDSVFLNINKRMSV